MPELRARSPFGVLIQAGRHGAPVEGAPATVISERNGLEVRTISALCSKGDAVLTAITSASGLAAPNGPKSIGKDGLILIGTGPGQWLAIAESEAGRVLLDKLCRALEGLASITDQSDGKAVLRISGPKTRDVLAKGCSLDLHPRVFRVGNAGTTPVALLDCVIWQIDDAPTYDLAVPSSFAESFFEWLTASAAEFGYEVR